RFGFREQALEMWAKIVKGELRIAPRATTVSDGVQEMLALLHAPELLGDSGHDDSVQMKDKQREEELLARYAPLVLRADPTSARQLFFSSPGTTSRYRISPTLVVKLLQGVEDPCLSQRLQESFIEEVVMKAPDEQPQTCCQEKEEDREEAERQFALWQQEARELQTQLAKTYIDRLLASSPSATEAPGGQMQPSDVDVREKLLRLLETKENYDVHALLLKVEGSWLLKEAAVLYGRLGRHLPSSTDFPQKNIPLS
ncbi:TGF beta receptor associated-like protein, partial [Toxoplasma gondii MAS]